eukprot:m.162882 g.162882  ORF g.162882 m.162882 type:complete len:56 (+) comp16544_c1_seq1:1755-1922(+)
MLPSLPNGVSESFKFAIENLSSLTQHQHSSTSCFLSFGPSWQLANLPLLACSVAM